MLITGHPLEEDDTPLRQTAYHVQRQFGFGAKGQITRQATFLPALTVCLIKPVFMYIPARIQKALLRLMQGRPSFVIAHRLSTIRDADRVIVINNGEVVEQGTHQQLLDRRGFYHHLYVSQFKGQQI